MKVDMFEYTSLFTWWWLPSLGSQLVLNACYSLQVLSMPQNPRVRNNHIQLARTAVIVGRLLYQLHGLITTSPPNYYQLLALPLDVDSDGVKRCFRALARKYHPDKVGESGEAFFIILRRAHDALSDPVKRFAYDRFGPEMANWKDCNSLRDYTKQGLMGLVAFYTINPAMYALLAYINNGGRTDGLSFWRLACLFSLLAAELSLLVSPDYPVWLTILLPKRTIFDLRRYAHSLFINFFFASMQMSAALDVLEYGEEGAPPRDKASKAAMAERQLEVVKVKTAALNQVAEVVAKGVMQRFARELRPFRTADGKKGDGKGREIGEVEEMEMGEVEEMMFERIDAVLLARSLVQQNPQLANITVKGGNGESWVAKDEGAWNVNKQEPQQEAMMPEAKSEAIVVKEELQEEPVSAVPESCLVKLEPIETAKLMEVDAEKMTAGTAKVEAVEQCTGSRNMKSEASSAIPSATPSATVTEQEGAAAPAITPASLQAPTSVASPEAAVRLAELDAATAAMVSAATEEKCPTGTTASDPATAPPPESGRDSHRSA
ncbi:hypothetical protein NDA11_005493 [Ustilago hordei]|uniref:J domain-containing protein n=1 Tax=Ustilago hordei TaxID=120017 RepID=I2FWN7_USTHO|nr:uncharacterized protein UHO2_04148 [Ustilago hordei]KAJ1573664.1 hypothetical protein NDA15_001224 [Ustilago hordei]KAJ1579394.1 hypothetical protein NDA11_005493 [Ustilago hordei]KAJ1579681.1 hypothetical protein NDA12_004525 [Ustilago hordei]KAJ1598495.1 hypothetical protein NDA14_001907 [Ustilago hordei]CCF51330.1 uncharacterized protein UHOR_05283 [Ustilago hordei]